MTTTIKADSPASFLALIPTLTGQDPTGNFLVIPFSGSRTMGAFRFDIPTVGDELAHHVTSALSSLDLSDRVALVVYPRDHEERASAVLESVLAGVRRAGFAVIDALVVGVEDFYSVLDVPRERHRLSEIEAAAERLGVSLVAPSYADDSGLREEAGQPLDVPHIRMLMRQIEAGQEFWKEYYDEALHAVHRGEATNLDVARIGHGLLDVSFRDRIIPGVADQRAGLGHAATMALMTGDRTEIDLRALKQGRAIMLTIADACEDEQRESQALTVAAWFDWALGRGSRAHAFLEKASEVDPDNTLAPLLDTFISAGVIPQWAVAAANRSAR